MPNLVVDPVSVSKHGHRLLEPNAVAALRERILPLATLVTPNLPETAALIDAEVRRARRCATPRTRCSRWGLEPCS